MARQREAGVSYGRREASDSGGGLRVGTAGCSDGSRGVQGHIKNDSTSGESLQGPVVVSHEAAGEGLRGKAR